MKDRLAVFFDGANHTEALNKAKVRMDYGNFLLNLEKSFKVVGARYYSGVSDDERHKGVRDFLASLAKTNIVLVTKPVWKQADGSVKCNMDIEIAVDMLTMAPRLDRVLLFSGDGDFRYLVDTIQRMGIFVTVCSHKPFASSDLRDQCNEFLELQEVVKKYST